MPTRVCAYIPARNEEKHLPGCLDALLGQTRSPDNVILIDDGSTDRTGKIGRKKGCIVVKLKDRGRTLVESPELSQVHNAGLRECRRLKADYVLVVGADHILSGSYLEKLLDEMQSDSTLAISSGYISGEQRIFPSGSGRLISRDFLSQVSWRYPYINGWEAYFVFKALSLGYSVKIIATPSKVTRGTFIKRRWGSEQGGLEIGKSMRRLGYWKPYAWLRCLRLFSRPTLALAMLLGYITETHGAYDEDVAAYIKRWQKARMVGYVQNLV
ncbi:MAG: glycosyltransferase family 2 protein [Candidatus Bathyarchaeota archaeon]|nr:MAG: glycosyltransferase family 2 protein [Candidatus Bathyarchaeota archaeon]